jgi:nucleoside-diphosphate-sugar epimerase
MKLELSGKNVVVTGGSKGIGLAVVRTLLDEGMRVVSASRNLPDSAWEHTFNRRLPVRTPRFSQFPCPGPQCLDDQVARWKVHCYSVMCIHITKELSLGYRRDHCCHLPPERTGA